MKVTARNWIGIWSVLAGLLFSLFLLLPTSAEAVNLIHFKDTVSNSGPSEQSNHTFDFTINTDLSAGSYFQVDFPMDFEVMSTSTFDVRNVELIVDGTSRYATNTAASGIDGVSITTGLGGSVRYTLATDYSISSGSNVEFKIGNHTASSTGAFFEVSTSTGTTSKDADIQPIINTATTGKTDIPLTVYDGVEVANADFVIFIIEPVQMADIDTRESIPPERFNGAPTSTVGGTTLNVEISLETNEFSICKWSRTASTSYDSMTETFDNTGLIFHSEVVAVTPNSTEIFYVRCMDDEDNQNIDDYIITFVVNDTPTGSSNEDGDISGDGSGTGNDGTGDGSGAGGTTGDSDGEASEQGDNAGSAGSGGGGGGGSGSDDGEGAGGGFESEDAPYRSGDGRVIISGHAYPGVEVTILVDGNFYETIDANGEGSFSTTLDEIGRGVYTFGVYAEDDEGNMSSTFSTSFTVTGARTSALGNVNIAPTILVTPDPVDPNSTVTFSGFALPDATVYIENGQLNATNPSQELTVTSDSDGQWSLDVPTDNWPRDTYQVRAYSEQDDGEETQFSDYTFYGVGQDADVPISADLNQDGSVNLIDFSILLFWWGTDGGASFPPADINGDSTVSLTDFSILLFNWTG